MVSWDSSSKRDHGVIEKLALVWRYGYQYTGSHIFEWFIMRADKYNPKFPTKSNEPNDWKHSRYMYRREIVLTPDYMRMATIYANKIPASSLRYGKTFGQYMSIADQIINLENDLVGMLDQLMGDHSIESSLDFLCKRVYVYYDDWLDETVIRLALGHNARLVTMISKSSVTRRPHHIKHMSKFTTSIVSRAME